MAHLVRVRLAVKASGRQCQSSLLCPLSGATPAAAYTQPTTHNNSRNPTAKGGTAPPVPHTIATPLQWPHQTSRSRRQANLMHSVRYKAPGNVATRSSLVPTAIQSGAKETPAFRDRCTHLSQYGDKQTPSLDVARSYAPVPTLPCGPRREPVPPPRVVWLQLEAHEEERVAPRAQVVRAEHLRTAQQQARVVWHGRSSADTGTAHVAGRKPTQQPVRSALSLAQQQAQRHLAIPVWRAMECAACHRSCCRAPALLQALPRTLHPRPHTLAPTPPPLYPTHVGPVEGAEGAPRRQPRQQAPHHQHAVAVVVQPRPR